MIDELTIHFNLKENAGVQVSLMSIDGKTVQAIFEDRLTAGDQELKMNVNAMKPGIYFLQINTNAEMHYEKVLVGTSY